MNEKTIINHNGRKYEVQYTRMVYTDGTISHQLIFRGRILEENNLEKLLKKFKVLIDGKGL